MSATYQITVEHRPHEQGSLRWIATVHRVSDGERMGCRWAESGAEAESSARELVYELNTQQEGWVSYTDDNGNPVERHSVKA